ncbi:hypothetical protein A2524_03550 [Candidatus Wolfebacteria bacterium RIFOXYD12_FULL_48_21]|uniref:Uncharacterized protein n=1 Tax=Candidatus Wolfebacteria bacterium RIFOXYD1_FULL_48_65 TaxID=1802561 RepID=A0A1F8E090_9BACT|nr:MAG: hypothetical protein A2610_00090 [Candidatus Wolfebacteria bacterium RIFOXYD1_FULL_48_65]OGM95132.1 MAG: hypothetical protein A2524_03550 [Candidatus Wolfebacteria bacterium RIFOXYD12_FULL_48_21]OGM96455.1 MAG: hypothetical protein A2532_00840 [Candidatus Wolfebacteria bacterium RIFOXYD2_FULL_48_11]
MYSIIVAILSFSLFASCALAATTGPGPTVQTAPNEPIGSSITFDSAFGNATITDVLNRLIDYGIAIAASLAAIMILWGAFQIMTSAGVEKKYAAGKQTILYALGGLVIIILARGLVAIFRGLIIGLGA